MVSYCEIVTFPLVQCILGQVWYLIVSIPDLCTLTYFESIGKVQTVFQAHKAGTSDCAILKENVISL